MSATLTEFIALLRRSHGVQGVIVEHDSCNGLAEDIEGLQDALVDIRDICSDGNFDVNAVRRIAERALGVPFAGSSQDK